jgi:hypothetical protein
MNNKRFYIPRWVVIIYLMAVIVMLPWTVNLAYVLPVRHLADHWDITWVGVDVGEIFTMLLTFVFAVRHSKLIVISAAATGTLLIVDAWFDTLSSSSTARYKAIILAAAVEIPLAIISYGIAYSALVRHTSKHKKH